MVHTRAVAVVHIDHGDASLPHAQTNLGICPQVSEDESPA